ncbi:MAG: thermonuclease family protein [Gammaproteobacteria bacterium]|nr:thermonuclease family protein [Gammaproteobacteria bacterium]
MVRSLAFAATLIFAASANSQTCTAPSCFHADVVAVADGDTVTVLRQTDAGPRQIKVRLTEIDAPERGQPWGTRARQALADKVFGRTVRVAASGRDRYGRLLARLFVLFVADGDTLAERDVNRDMVREGHAWVYRRYATQNWLPDEAMAREAGSGLWSLGVAASVPPWEWRRGKQQERPKVAATSNAPAAAGTSFSCRKRYCREMTSCAEARFHLETCGVRSIDGDNDGIPCEYPSVCGR